jgi:hypothetical protein
MAIPQPKPGDWYWVSRDETQWWPALHSVSAVGGWTNLDTWEDFDRSVKFWQPIAPPRMLGPIERSRLLVPEDHYAKKCIITRCDDCLNYFMIQHSAWTRFCSPLCAVHFHRSRVP